MKKLITIAGIDIGSSVTKVLLAQKKPEEANFEVLGRGIFNSLGVRKGVVSDPEKAGKVIESALEQAKREAGKEIDRAYVNLNGSHLFSLSSKGLVSVSKADQKISQEDVDRVIEAAKIFSLPSNKEIVEVIPQEYNVDEEEGVKSPIGLTGIRLEAKILAIGGFSPYIESTAQAVENGGVVWDSLCLGPLAASRAVLNNQEKELGVVLIDLGAATTGISVFEEGSLIHTAIIPIGSDNIRNDIAIGFQVSIDTADRIKEEMGSHIFSKRKKQKEKVKISQGEEVEFKVKQLQEIAQLRMDEIFDLVEKELKSISRAGLLPGGVVLTGGGANLENIEEFVKKKMKLPCRIGVPKGFLTSQEDPSLAVVCGLVKMGLSEEKRERSLVNFNKGIGGKIKRIFRVFLP